jgi:hypothetical protein
MSSIVSSKTVIMTDYRLIYGWKISYDKMVEHGFMGDDFTVDGNVYDLIGITNGISIASQLVCGVREYYVNILPDETVDIKKHLDMFYIKETAEKLATALGARCTELVLPDGSRCIKAPSFDVLETKFEVYNTNWPMPL